jgi:hypothetical protein
MTELVWRNVKTTEKTSELKMTPGSLWRRAIDFVPGPRLLRLQVTDKDGKPLAAAAQWGPAGNLSSPDGLPTSPPKGTLLLCTTAPIGALIGKLGGSSADNPDTTANAPPFGTKKVFAVGSYCVISLSKDDGGPLFLTRNDVLDAFSQDMGSLFILIEEATS